MATGPLARFAGLRSLPATAVRMLGVGVGFVVLVTALFAGVGAWQDRDLTAAPRPTEPVPAPDPAPAPTPDDSDDTDDAVDDDSDDTDDSDDSDGPDGTEDPAPPPPVTGPRPADVTVQLLNGSGVEGATRPFRTRLEEAGFRIVAANTARARDVTTIFYTVGFEAEGRLVASVIGTDQVFPMTDLPPDRRLRGSVMVHVVVGADRP